MKSLVISDVEKTEFVETTRPDPGAGEVLVDVKFVGLCGSDLNTYLGLNPLVQLPRIPGHEIGGVVAAQGPDVGPDLAVGQPVVVIPYTTCGSCPSCRKGRVNACQYNQTLGVQQDGALRPQIVVKTDRLIPNDTLPLDQLALVEPLSVGFHAVARGSVVAQDSVLVLGGGMIGAGAILGAKARGARVLVSEPSPAKRDGLKALGVDMIINPASQDIAMMVAEATEGAGPDVIVEAVGTSQTFRAAVDLAPFAGRVVYVGYAKAEVAYDTKYFNLKELDIFGSRNATRADFEQVIGFLEANPHIATQLISKVIPWPRADGALYHWTKHRDETFKIIIDMQAGV
ncbi:MAG: zinc-binding alcohol dehydrogenase family protein [Pseudomonadota bacterium]